MGLDDERQREINVSDDPRCIAFDAWKRWCDRQYFLNFGGCWYTDGGSLLHK